MTVGVYGLVGVIVKIDDLGYWLAEKSSALMQALGKGLLIIAPWLMKAVIDCRHAGDVPRRRRDCGTWYCAVASRH
ncbi:putative methyl-independent mismatch repair protein [Escherichia coli]|uniref:Putative methyl-independent mismatch repair protein n=1 Tax=Escherichia coli TaxID=562 RepID=A0A376S8L0_ECOLX|nr:putative methyl-independent mismatch repair protein [Escherichia coli]